MFSPLAIVAVILLYVGCLFAVALWVERKEGRGRRWANTPIVYSLSLAIYCTAWTFYGSVGKAATSGMMFIAVYLGPTLAVFLWWTVLRKLIRIKNRHHITSIADFISARYDKSPVLAALVTTIALVGIIAYVALQLKSIFSSIAIIIIPGTLAAERYEQYTGFVIVALMIVFTIVFGVRRLDPTERHEGMVMALALECLVKLGAFLAVGIFVTYQMFDGFGDIFQRLSESPFRNLMSLGGTPETPYATWISYLVLSMSAILFLPRQFHIAVVENSDEDHIRTAMWLFPLYMLLITIFTLPIAAGGLLKGLPVSGADNFVLTMPLNFGPNWLTMLTFIGGFSAATGMVIVCAMTLSTMMTNHLLLPLIHPFKKLSVLQRHLLECRWVAAGSVILLGYWFERQAGESYTLVTIGLVSFAAVLQFAPPIIGGLFWRRGNKVGALLGLNAGFIVWLYTLFIPSLIRSGWLQTDLIKAGPWGIAFLKPEQLFGLTGFDTISHAVFWSMFFNIGFYLLGSLCFAQSKEEQAIAEEFVDILSSEAVLIRPIRGEADIVLEEKRREIEALLGQYLGRDKAVALTLECIKSVGIEGKNRIYAGELFELHGMVERRLAGSIGAASARKAMREGMVLSADESRSISEVYAEILADLNVTPADLRKKIDFQQEREALLTAHSRELEEKIRERDEQIVERIRTEEALRNSETRLSDLINLLPDATFAIDLNGVITLWNKAAEDITGARAQDMIGKGDREYSIPFYGERRPVLIDLVFTPSEDIEREYPNIKREGNVVFGESVTLSVKRGKAYMSGIAAPLYDSGGNVVGAVESVRDITERKQAEDALKEAHDTLEHTVEERTAELRATKEAAESANKAKSIFLSNMSHELRTPLNAILGYSQLMQRDASIRSEQREYLDTINRSGEHLLRLINDVLEISKIEAHRAVIDHVTFDLPAMISDLHSMFSVKTDAKGLYFMLEGVNDLPRYVVTDEGKLRQMLINLIGNAVKFTEQGGISVRVLVEGGAPDDKHLVVEVMDSGPGIAGEELEKVFQAFEQTASGRRTTGGTGLGMPISREYARMLGGDITVTSRLGEGSTFRLEMDIREGSESDLKGMGHKSRVTGLVPGQEVPRVLVVEDLPESRTLLVSLLKMTGFEVREAVNGREAVDICAEWHPRLIWMDIRMPVMDGMEATRLIKGSEAGGSITIVAITASGMLEDRNAIMTAGFDDFMRKPFREQEIFEIMAKYLGVKYQYENVSEIKTHREPPEELSLQKMASALSPEFLDELRTAVLTLDTAQTMTVIEKIALREPSVGAALKKLALDLDYDRLLTLLEQNDAHQEESAP